MRPEVITILKALANKNQSAIAMEKKTMEVMAQQQDLRFFIEDLRTEIQKTKDAHDDRIPFYNFCLAVILLKQNDIEEAKDVLSEAVHGFRILGWTLNEAIGEWFFSTIHYENEDFDRAERACEKAIEMLESLIKQYDEESKYENAKEISAYLMQLEIFRDDILAVADSSKSLLHDYKKKLNNKLEYLKRHKKKISPTLVAAIFYLYKTITPAHSVYCKVPPPETSREKEIYDELIKKIGFFEVIEQLVDLEREFGSEASREKILEKINLAWDNEVKSSQK
jgi:tetratricopeptide (TPR) repeat protein